MTFMTPHYSNYDTYRPLKTTNTYSCIPPIISCCYLLTACHRPQPSQPCDPPLPPALTTANVAPLPPASSPLPFSKAAAPLPQATTQSLPPTITAVQVTGELRRLRPRKAAGPDGV